MSVLYYYKAVGKSKKKVGSPIAYFLFSQNTKKGLVFFFIYLYPTCITNEA